MARALHQRRGRPLIMPLDPSIPCVEVKPVPFWAPAKGVDYRSRITNVPREFTSDALNMLVRDGVWYSRYGVVRVAERRFRCKDRIMKSLEDMVGFGFNTQFCFT